MSEVSVMKLDTLFSRFLAFFSEDLCPPAAVLESPQLVSPRAVDACDSALNRDSTRRSALGALAAVLLAAPGLSRQVPISVLDRCRHNKELYDIWPSLLVLMLHTARRSEVAEWLRSILNTAEVDTALLQALQYVSDWFPEELSLEQLDAITSRADDAAPYTVLRERQLFRQGLCCCVSSDASPCLAELSSSIRRLLVVHNIVDGLGDELIRTNALMQAFLDGCPQLKITLFTDRQFLYDHERVRTLPIKDTERFSEEVAGDWDGIVDFFEPYLPSISYNVAVEGALKKRLEEGPPPFYLWARKNINHYVIESLLLNGKEFAGVWKLNERRLPLCYETTMRLIAELGLPLRFGEQTASAGCLLGALPEETLHADWQELLNKLSAGSSGGSRPVALLNVFGGQSQMKGFQKCTYPLLYQIMAQLVEMGFDLVLAPNGEDWGGEQEIAALTDGLPDELRHHVAAATFTGAGSAQEMMRAIKYFAIWSDLIVAVEGWMIHLAYALGKPYYLLMAPHSYGSEWHPHGRSANQGKRLALDVPEFRSEFVLPAAENAGLTPPLLHFPEKNLLKAALEVWSVLGDRVLAGRLLYWMGSADKDIRCWVLTAVGKIDAAAFQAELLRALEDCNREVRAAAASALLNGARNLSAELGSDWQKVLLAYQLLGQFRFQELRPLGFAAFRALRACLNRDEMEVHRDATITLESMQLTGAVSQIQVCDEFELPTILILTPVKNAAQDADGYFSRLRGLSYPRQLLSVGILESDSSDNTFEVFQKHCNENRSHFGKLRIWKKDFDYQIPAGTPRWEPRIQLQRRTILARSRNHLLFHALDDEEWVLWLDSDVIEFPCDIIQKLLSYNKDILQPHCVKKYCGPSFDLNAWRDHGRLFMHDLRPEGEITPIDAVGGTMLLIRADCHRDGLVFPPFLYGKRNGRIRNRIDIHLPNEEGEVETEGLGILASDMSLQCWALPHLEIIHADR